MSSKSLTTVQKPTLVRPAVIVAPWYRVALGAILLLSVVLNVFQLDRVGLGNTYYAAAVKSMTQSWHNFFFVAFDPGAFVIIDKPPVAFWIQAASVKLFGFSGLSLLLPEAIAGVLSVWLLYSLVSRSFGRPAGLLAALALAITPVAVLVDRSNLLESILVLTVILAAWAVIRATETGSLRWLLLGFALAGVGFNVKMLEAYLAVPALFLMYFLGVSIRWRTRIVHLILAGAVLLIVSLLWVTAVDVTPANQRPYVASSGNNSELNLALGYNGLGRLTGNTFSFLGGGATVSSTLSDLSPTNLGFSRGETGGPGVQRLVNAELGGQTSWLLILAVIGFLVATWRRLPRFPLDRRQGSLVLWGAWLLTGGAFFSIAGTFHAYYLATITAPVAALAGIGIVALWDDYRRPGWRGWALPLALALTALVQAHILSYFPAWNGWMTPLVVGVSIVASIALIALRLGRRPTQPFAMAAVAAGCLSLLIAPAIWSEYTVAHASGKLGGSAGPGGNGAFGGFGGGGHRSAGRGGVLPRGVGASFWRGGFGRDGTTANPSLVRYLESHQGHARFLVATLTAGEAEPFILATGKSVMDLGGFMGGDHILDVKGLASLVSKGTVRYFLISGRGGRFRAPRDLPRQFREFPRGQGGFRGGFGGSRDANTALTTWVTKHCRAVSSSAYGVLTPQGIGAGNAIQPLYDCGNAASRAPAT